MSELPSCRDCVFFLLDGGDSFYECHRNAPILQEGSSYGRYPRVYEGAAGCGEFRDKAPKSAQGRAIDVG